MQIPHSAIFKQRAGLDRQREFRCMRFPAEFRFVVKVFVGLPFWLLTFIRPKHSASFCYRMGWGH